MNLYSIARFLTFDVAKIAKPIKQCLLQVGVGGRGTRAAFETPLMLPCVFFIADAIRNISRLRKFHDFSVCGSGLA
jgi:hypothetical protein